MGKQPYSIETIFSNRPTVADYATLNHEVKEFVDSIIKHNLKPNKIIRVKGKSMQPVQDDFWLLSWEQLIQVKQAVNDVNMPEVFKLVYGVAEKTFLKLDLFNCFASYKWITEQLKEIEKAEEQELHSELTADEKNAGVEELVRFDYTVALDALANGDILKYDAILQKPYAVIFRKLCLEKVKTEIQKRHIENVSRKAKTRV